MISLEMVAFDAMDAKINANIVDTGWWADPGVWLVTAVALIIIILIGIYFKVLVEHQKFDMRR